MNKQYKSPTKRGIEWCDYTHNPISGCFHACQWQMPSGAIANCYAEDVAEGIASPSYPQKFEHHYWKPAILDEPLKLKKPAKIFVGSMADVFGHWVPADQIQQVLDVCAKAHWHTFQMLTKNPVRVKEFDLPPNVWIGASLPADFMWNKPLSADQKERMLNRTLDSLSKVKATVVWMSIEPLSWDCSRILESYDGVLQWVVIGAASNGATFYPPSEDVYRNVEGYFYRQSVPVFLKGNMRSLPYAAAHWQENFPVIKPPTTPPDGAGQAPTVSLEPEPTWVLRCRQYGYDPAEIERDLARFQAELSWDYPLRAAVKRVA